MHRGPKSNKGFYYCQQYSLTSYLTHKSCFWRQVLWLVHTMNTDKTKLSCLLRVRGVNWVRNSRRQFSIYWKRNNFVLSAVWTHLRTRQGSVYTVFRYWTKLFWNFQLQTVLTCLQFSSHREYEHGQDKTVLSCPCSRCELAITWHLVALVLTTKLAATKRKSHKNQAYDKTDPSLGKNPKHAKT